MTAPAKEVTRILSRAESLRVALQESGLSREWERADLQNMADAAIMLWDQANSAAAKNPEARLEMSEAIARLFEPLLNWSSRFDLCAKLAQARAAAPAFRASTHDARLSLFEALAFQGRFHDQQAWRREGTFRKAQDVFVSLSDHHESWQSEERARASHAWFLIGLDGIARQLLDEPSIAKDALSYFETHPAPIDWRAAHISSPWMKMLHDLATQPR